MSVILPGTPTRIVFARGQVEEGDYIDSNHNFILIRSTDGTMKTINNRYVRYMEWRGEDDD